MKNSLAVGCYKYKNSEPPIFLNDLSTCCKGLPVSNTFKKINRFKLKSSMANEPSPPVASSTSMDVPANTFPTHSTLDGSLKKSNPVTSIDSKPSPNLQTDNQHILIIEKPSDNHLVVQTASCVSSVTVNTGTQYIHNIYPDKSCVYVEPSTRNTQFADTNREVPCEISKKSDPDVQVIHRHVTSENAIIVDDDDDIPAYTEPLSTTKLSDFLALKEQLSKKPMPMSKKQTLLRTVLMSESIESMKKHLQSNNLSPTCPESFNSIGSNKTNEEFCLNSNINVSSNNTDQNEKEPILKSILHTTTERLPNLKRKPVSFVNIDNSNPQILQKNVSGGSGGNTDMHSKSIQETCNNQIPRIKVRPVEELQERRPNCLLINDESKRLNEPSNIVVNLHNVGSLKGMNESNAIENLNNVDSLKSLNESNNIVNLHYGDSHETLQETNVTGLKQGIIEASRTLVNTQKKLKELAKVISNKLTFQTGKATEMVTAFQDILKLCQKQIGVIDKNITSQYYHNILQNKKPAVSVGVSSNEAMKKSNALHVEKRKQKMKRSKVYFSRSVALGFKDEEEEYEVEKTIASNDSYNLTSCHQNSNLSKEMHNNNMMNEIPVKRKRDSIVINPLGNKVILGTPEITQEDLEQINTTGEDMSNQEKNSLLSEQAQKLNLTKLKKKKNVWSYTSKKRAYNKKNLIRKKIRRSIVNSWNKDENDRDTFPETKSTFVVERLRRRNKKSCRPLRSSDRKHPSSASLAASMFPLQENVLGVVSNIPVGCVVKPCSVIVHKLDPRIVQLMEKRVKDL